MNELATKQDHADLLATPVGTRETSSGRARKHGCAGRGATAPEYWVWNAMRQRCSNPKDRAYKNYGARGIVVCERWHLFANFIADMGPRPPGGTLERKDNNRGYEPGNCAWATWSEQHHNKRVSRRNKNGVTGVCWDGRRQMWRAEIMVNRKKTNLGRFGSYDDAIAARVNAEIREGVRR